MCVNDTAADEAKVMRIIRASRKNQPYFFFSRATAQDRSLSWAARGVLAYLLSKPDDWEVDPQDLEQNCGRDKVYNLLAELSAAKYLERKTIRDSQGLFIGITYIVHEIPFSETPDAASPVPAEPTQTKYREEQITDSSLDALHQDADTVDEGIDETPAASDVSATPAPDHGPCVELLGVPEGYAVRWELDRSPDLVPSAGYSTYRKIGHLIPAGKKQALCRKQPTDETLPRKATETVAGELWCLCAECQRIAVAGQTPALTALQRAIGTHLLNQASDPTITANLAYINKLQRVLLTAEGYAPGQMPSRDESQRLADTFAHAFVPWFHAEFQRRYKKSGSLPKSEIKLAQWYGEWVSLSRPDTNTSTGLQGPQSDCSQCHGTGLIDYIIETPGATPRPLRQGEDLSLFPRHERYAQDCPCLKGGSK
jgi:hypothetical protein